MATLGLYDDVADQGTTTQIAHGPGGRAARGRAGMNLAAVGEVLARYGLDPADRLGEILTRKEKVIDRNGNVVIDAETGEPVTRPALDTDTEARLLTELLQYTRPKLKAIEVTVKEPELTDEQIERRLEALMAREAKGKL
jgi:hypothetical protein